MVFDGFDHDRVLHRRGRDLHAARATDRRVWDISVAADFVRGIDDDDALIRVIGEHARNFAQHGRLADAGPAEEQNALPPKHQVFDDTDGAIDRTADAAREPHDFPAAVADARDAVERAFDPGAVIVTEIPDALDNVFEVLIGDFAAAEHDFTPGIARFGEAPKVHHNFEERGAPFIAAERFDDMYRKRFEQQIEVIRDDLLAGEKLVFV
jgi:hypothetical protein